MALAGCLCSCAERGVQTVLSIDGFGSARLSCAFVQRLSEAGVAVNMYDPGRSLFGQQLNLLRRMHRKLVVVDETVAFVGGINFCADQLLGFGELAKQDYAVSCTVPSCGMCEISCEARRVPTFPRPNPLRPKLGPRPCCSSPATTRRRPTVSKPFIGRQFARRVRGCASRMPISFRAIACFAISARRLGAASTPKIDRRADHVLRWCDRPGARRPGQPVRALRRAERLRDRQPNTCDFRCSDVALRRIQALTIRPGRTEKALEEGASGCQRCRPQGLGPQDTSCSTGASPICPAVGHLCRKVRERRSNTHSKREGDSRGLIMSSRG
jgi:Phospholipase D Active site motif